MPHHSTLRPLLALLFAAALAAAEAPTPAADGNSALVPVTRLEATGYDWDRRHAEKAAACATGSYDLVFIGDSLTHGFEEDHGAAVWKAHYGSLRTLNLGFGWDRIQNVLWRLGHGELAGQKPRLVVLNIGTNNLTATPVARRNSAEEIVAGIAAVCARIDELAPGTRIVVMGIFPRAWANSHYVSEARIINRRLAELFLGNPGIQVLDLTDRFTGPDGQLDPRYFLPDRTHLTAAGYALWAEALQATVDQACTGLAATR